MKYVSISCSAQGLCVGDFCWTRPWLVGDLVRPAGVVLDTDKIKKVKHLLKGTQERKMSRLTGWLRWWDILSPQTMRPPSRGVRVTATLPQIQVQGLSFPPTPSR